MSYYFSKQLEISFDEAITKTIEQLQVEGFGVRTEIYVAKCCFITESSSIL